VVAGGTLAVGWGEVGVGGLPEGRQAETTRIRRTNRSAARCAPIRTRIGGRGQRLPFTLVNRRNLLISEPLSLYPFTLPSVSPEMSHLEEYRKRVITGTMTRIEAAEKTPHSVLYENSMFHRPTGQV
jgi:hypothetical protein